MSQVTACYVTAFLLHQSGAVATPTPSPTPPVFLYLVDWFFFSVVAGLFHLGVGYLIWRARNKPFRFRMVLEDGSLLFFAAPLTAGVFGECYINHSLTQGWQLFALVSMILTVVFAVTIYSAVINDTFAPRRKYKLNMDIMCRFSECLAVFAVFYGIALTCLRLKSR